MLKVYACLYSLCKLYVDPAGINIDNRIAFGASWLNSTHFLQGWHKNKCEGNKSELDYQPQSY